jgi:hypothetical protein
MDIIEIGWLKQNKENLTIDQLKKLEEYNFFEQAETGRFEMKFRAFIDMCKDVIQIYNDHNDHQQV